MKRSAIAVAATAATLLAALAALPAAGLAQTAPAPAASTPAPALLGMPELIELLRQRGYSDIREIERKRSGRYEVDAREPAGQRVELLIDARNGEILRRKREDRGD